MTILIMANTINLQYGFVKDSNLAHSLISEFFIMSFLVIIKNYKTVGAGFKPAPTQCGKILLVIEIFQKPKSLLKRLLFQGGGIKPGVGLIAKTCCRFIVIT